MYQNPVHWTLAVSKPFALLACRFNLLKGLAFHLQTGRVHQLTSGHERLHRERGERHFRYPVWRLRIGNPNDRVVQIYLSFLLSEGRNNEVLAPWSERDDANMPDVGALLTRPPRNRRRFENRY